MSAYHIFRLSNDGLEGSKYEFKLYDKHNLNNLPLDKSGIAIITSNGHDLNKDQFLYYFITEKLSQYIEPVRLEYFKINKQELLKEFNQLFNTQGDCILFCEIDKNRNELETILDKIIKYRTALGK